jgi:hypothetical protein
MAARAAAAAAGAKAKAAQSTAMYCRRMINIT